MYTFEDDREKELILKFIASTIEKNMVIPIYHKWYGKIDTGKSEAMDFNIRSIK